MNGSILSWMSQLGQSAISQVGVTRVGDVIVFSCILCYCIPFSKSCFFQKITNFQYFEVLSKSELLGIKQNLCIAE